MPELWKNLKEGSIFYSYLSSCSRGYPRWFLRTEFSSCKCQTPTLEFINCKQATPYAKSSPGITGILLYIQTSFGPLNLGSSQKKGGIWHVTKDTITIFLSTKFK
jgi:hypothetical protein